MHARKSWRETESFPQNEILFLILIIIIIERYLENKNLDRHFDSNNHFIYLIR